MRSDLPRRHARPEFRREPYPGGRHRIRHRRATSESAHRCEVTFAGWRGTESVSFIGQPHMQRGTVRVARNCSGHNAHLAASPRDPYGDFSAIGNENFCKHANRI